MLNDTGSTAVLSGNVWADDIHLTSPGTARQVEFGYVAGGATLATISFYDNTATNSIWPGAGAQLLYTQSLALDPQSSGIGVMIFDTPVQLPKDVWFAIRFNGFNGAVPLYNPPVDGTSDDVLVRGYGTSFTGSGPQNYFGVGKNNFQLRIGTELPNPGTGVFLSGSLLLLGTRRRRD